MPSTQPPGAAHRDAAAARFGARLKHWRRARRRTQAQLARDLDVDGSYISKLESARRQPTLDIASRCDSLLETGGELTSLLQEEPVVPVEPRPAVPMPVLWTAPPPVSDDDGPPAYANTHTTVTLTRLLEAYIDIDSTMGGQQIRASVEQQAQDIIRMQIGAPFPVRRALLTLAARFARLAGWIRSDNRDANGALFWHDCGQRWAMAGEDPDLAAELLARQSIVHAATGDHAGAVALAGSVKRISPDITVTGLTWAALGEARTHARAGNEDAAMEQLEVAGKRFAEVPGSLLSPPASHGNDYLWHTVTGKVHLDLALAGRRVVHHATEAVPALATALEALSAKHVRDRALTRLRLARALRLAGMTEAATQQLTAAEELSRRCASSRVHAMARMIRELLDAEATPTGLRRPTYGAGRRRRIR
ncbi:helix-turn-helix protein [Stackebrandtia albiflava]|uniref:Helix-turn-helix protein n=1 Tax=Stackebrandtia albiflava TaxID=406432 RepID=A0A562VBW7_9ACTN|nr:helix-turn-helix transcriptional regulator [Stackebrandtia albiflava]TWJ15317.1 helix-turn-helix protein [Stackebrandtia albiflava]